MNIYTAIRLLIFRRLRQEKLKSAIMIIGVSIGVALFVAVNITKNSVFMSVDDTINAISGKANLQIRLDETGLPFEFVQIVRNIPGVSIAVPLIERMTFIEDRKEEFLIIGIDISDDQSVRLYTSPNKNGFNIVDPLSFLINPDSILITEEFSTSQGYEIGSVLHILTVEGLKKFVVRGFFNPAGPARVFNNRVAVVNINTAQNIFGKKNKYDRIDVIVDKQFKTETVINNIKERLPKSVQIGWPSLRSAQVDKLLFSFQFGLYLASLLTLLVASFSIFNVVSISVAQHKREIGILKILGMTKKSILYIFFLESILVGGISSFIGILLSLLLSFLLMTLLSKLISLMFMPILIHSIYVSIPTIIVGLTIGLITSLIAASYPAFVASNTRISSALGNVIFEELEKVNPDKPLIFGLIMIGVALLFSSMKPVYGFPLFGVLAYLFIIIGFSFTTMKFIFIFRRISESAILKIFSIEGKIAWDNLVKSIGRNTISISAIVISVGFVLNMAIFITSFKVSFLNWLDQSIAADVIVTPRLRGLTGVNNMPLSPNLEDDLSNIEGVEEIMPVRYVVVNLRGSGQDVNLLTYDLSLFLRYGTMTFIQGNPNRSYEEVINKGNILISGNLATKLNLKLGDTLSINTSSDEGTFKISGIIVSYASDLGMIFMDRKYYLNFWNDHLVDAFDIYIKRGYLPNDVSSLIAKIYGEKYKLTVLTNQEFKKEGEMLIERVYTLAHSLVLIAVIVSILGIVSTMIISVLDRMREIGILRVLGATGKQIKKILLIEAGLIGMISITFGTAHGIILSILNIYVINMQINGLYLKYNFPFLTALFYSCFTFLTITLSSYYPASIASQLDLSDTLHYK